MSYYAGYYNEGDGGRSKDESKNVCAVGEAIAAELRAAGIGVIHDTTIHDNPKYTGAYTRSEETVKKNLKQYPSIQVVLDVHRDGIMIDNTTKAKPTVTINGKKAAQTMSRLTAIFKSGCCKKTSPRIRERTAYSVPKPADANSLPLRYGACIHFAVPKSTSASAQKLSSSTSSI